jgi:hypothetical protein
VTTILHPALICSICCKPVAVQTSKTDEHGRAIHEECYVLKLQLLHASEPSRKPPETES